jgi:predicted regulator of Ras-like GTPase activity (Roadblock/LC7/MglB family)
MTANSEVLELLQEIAAVEGVRGAMLATAAGPIGAAEYGHLSQAVATDVVKTVRRLVIASTTANAPLRELLINFGPSRMMLRPLADDVLVVLLERETATGPIRALIDLEVDRIARVMRGEPVEPPMAAFGLDDADDDIGQLLASPLGPILRELEAVYHGYRKLGGLDQAQTRTIMHEQMREWLLCCNPSNYTLPLLLDGLSETMADDPGHRDAFVNDAQGVLRKSGVIR